jgi:hypothetical protein
LDQFLSLHPGTEWDTLLPYALAAYRSSYHRSLGCSPFEALYGRQFRTTSTIDAERLAHLEDLPEGWILETAARINNIKKLMSAEQLAQRIAANTEQVNPVKAGDHVRLRHQAKQKEQGKYSKPLLVLGTTPHTIEISDATIKDPLRTKSVHVKNVKVTSANGNNNGELQDLESPLEGTSEYTGETSNNCQPIDPQVQGQEAVGRESNYSKTSSEVQSSEGTDAATTPHLKSQSEGRMKSKCSNVEERRSSKEL